MAFGRSDMDSYLSNIRIVAIRRLGFKPPFVCKRFDESSDNYGSQRNAVPKIYSYRFCREYKQKCTNRRIGQTRFANRQQQQRSH